MIKRYELNDVERNRFKEIRETLGVTQKALHSRTGLTEAWLSNAFKGTRTRLQADMLAKVASELITGLEEQDISGSILHEWSEDAKAFLVRFSMENSPKIYPPGGIVPIGATNYIRRREEGDLLDEVVKLTSFSILIRGPVQSGKSSMLARLEDKAGDQGFETCWFDCQSALASVQNRDDSDEVTSVIVQALYEQLQLDWELKPANEQVDSIQKLNNWLLRCLEPDAKNLLIIDDLGHLGSHSAEQLFSLAVRPITNARARRKSNLSLAIGLTYEYAEARFIELMDASFNIPWSVAIDLEWLSEAECRHLHTMVGEGAWNPEIYQLTQGQPYLAHAAIVDQDFFQALTEWEHNHWALRGSKYFRRHLRSIQDAILGPGLTYTSRSGNLIETLSKANRGEISTISDGDLYYIKHAHLLDVNAYPRVEPAMPCYRLIAEMLAEQYSASQ